MVFCSTLQNVYTKNQNDGHNTCNICKQGMGLQSYGCRCTDLFELSSWTLMSYIVKFPPCGHLRSNKCWMEQKGRMVPACYFNKCLACSVRERNGLMWCCVLISFFSYGSVQSCLYTACCALHRFVWMQQFTNSSVNQ